MDKKTQDAYKKAKEVLESLEQANYSSVKLAVKVSLAAEGFEEKIIEKVIKFLF